MRNRNAVTDLLQRCGAAKRKPKDAAAWDACAVLFSNKTEASPVFKALASQYAGKIAFGEVRVNLRPQDPAPLTAASLTFRQAGANV